MKYRKLGRTGPEVSEIGLGCEGFVGKNAAEAGALFDTAVGGGINIMDLYTPNPGVRAAVGRGISGRRDRFVLQSHLCTVWKNGQYEATRSLPEVKNGFELMLCELGTDYIDVGMIHYVDSMACWKQISEGGILEYAQALRKAGRIRALGLSSHNPEAALAAVESGLIDVLMFSVNPCYDLMPAGEDCMELFDADNYSGGLTNMDPQREKLYETCQRLGVGMTVMKAFGGGDLLTSDSPAGKALTVCQCLGYALTRPAAVSVMAGVHTTGELEACLHYEEASDGEKDYAAALASFPRMSWKGHCMYCGHCAPCPKGIDVASVTKFYNLCRAQNRVPETVREHYAALEHKAGECIGCGACERRCPFGVEVRANMLKAKEVFGE